MKQFKPVYLAHIALILAASLAVTCSSTPQVSPAQQDQAREYYNLGIAYIDLKQYDKARVYLDRAITLWPDMPAINLALVRVMAEQNQLDIAAKMVDRLYYRTPDNLTVEEMRGFIQAKQNKNKEARISYLHVLGSVGERLSVLLNLARLYRDEDPVAAWGFFQRAMAVSTDASKLSLEAGDLAAAAGRVEEAYNQYAGYLSGATKDRANQLRIADFLQKNRYYAKALEIYKLLSGDPSDNGEAWFLTSRLQYLLANDPAAGADALKQALDKKYNNWKAVKDLYDKIAKERRGEFLAIVREVVPKFPELPVATPTPSPGSGPGAPGASPQSASGQSSPPPPPNGDSSAPSGSPPSSLDNNR